MLKPVVMGLLSAAIVMNSATVVADDKNKAADKKAFKQNMKHATFFPALMPGLLKGYKDGNALKLTEKQFKALQGYHKHHKPIMKKMVAALTKAEAEGREMMMNNYPPEKLEDLTNHTLNVRADIAAAKIKCRSFIRNVLSPEQYKNYMTKK